MSEELDPNSDERRLSSLFEAVAAPPSMRRWDGPVAADGGTEPRRGFRRLLEPGRHQAKPLLAAAVVVAVVAAAGALAGIGHLGPHRSGGAAGSGAGPAPRTGAAMAWDEATHSVILFGGRTASGEQNDTWSWDGSAWQQLTPGSSPPARSGASMDADGHGGLVLFGGTGTAAAPTSCPGVPGGPVIPEICAPRFAALHDTWTWNGQTWTEQHPAHAPKPGAGSMAFDTSDGSAVLLQFPPPQLVTGSAVACTGSGFATRPGGPAPSPPPAPSCAPVPTPPPPTAPPANLLWRWTGSDWTAISGPSQAGRLIGLATDPAGGLVAVSESVKPCLAVSGQGPKQPAPPAAGGASSPSAWTGYVPLSCDGPLAPPATPVKPPIACPAMPTGGPASCTTMPSVRIATPPAFALRTFHLDHSGAWRDLGTAAISLGGGLLASDQAHHQVLAISGSGTTVVWDGHTWTPGATESGLGGRSAASIAYDEANGRLVLFGGSVYGAVAGDTWTWDGSHWTRVAGTTPTGFRKPISRPAAVPTALPVPPACVRGWGSTNESLRSRPPQDTSSLVMSVTFVSGCAIAPYALTLTVVDAATRAPLRVQGNPVATSFASPTGGGTRSVTVRWANWCGTPPPSGYAITIGGQVLAWWPSLNGEPFNAPPCTDPTKPSTLTAVTT